MTRVFFADADGGFEDLPDDTPAEVPDYLDRKTVTLLEARDELIVCPTNYDPKVIVNGRRAAPETWRDEALRLRAELAALAPKPRGTCKCGHPRALHAPPPGGFDANNTAARECTVTGCSCRRYRSP